MKYLLAEAKHHTSVHSDAASDPKNHEVRVSVAFAGICHSDLARVAEGVGPFPFRMGHEVSGVVLSDSFMEYPKGTRVACYTKSGYATEINVPVSDLVRLDDRCTLLDGALAEPLACVIGGIDMLDLTHEREIVLVGAGFMGLLALRYLVVMGYRVTVVEPRENAQSAARDLGAYRVLAPRDDLSSSLGLQSVVVEATGASSGLDLASSLLGNGGTLGVLGYHQSASGRRQIDMESWNYRALRVLSLHHREPTNVKLWMDRAQRASANRVIRPSELVDECLSLADVPKIFSGSSQHAGIKTVVDFSRDS